MSNTRVSVTIDDFDTAAETFDEDFRIKRANAVAAHIADHVGFRPDQSVLDYGCGTGLLGFSLLPHIGQLTLLDTSQGMLQEAKRKISSDDAHRVRTVLWDPESGALPEHYDLIVTLMTLHHIPDPRAATTLLTAHLRPGGALAVADLDTEDGSFHGAGADVHRGFDRAVVRGWIEAGGLHAASDSTPWVMEKEINEVNRRYPVFLITARRRDATGA